MTSTDYSAISALSPLDGRYAAKVAALRPLLSEFGLMHRRVQVEVEWFIALSDAGFKEFKPLSSAARSRLRRLVKKFSEADAEEIKAIERTTNHDVKAVEYWIKRSFAASSRSCAAWPTSSRASRCSPARTARPPAPPPWARKSPTSWPVCAMPAPASPM